MHPDECALLWCALDSPGDPAPLLILADWYDDRQDTRAAFVRHYLHDLRRFTASYDGRGRACGVRTCDSRYYIWLTPNSHGFKLAVVANPPSLRLARFAPAGA
ncbi:MAG TPA: hypothetical protein VKE74_13900 [Gemmataceae bacterium]|nr:hypothetical protein [Gemmataceae bacterium]